MRVRTFHLIDDVPREALAIARDTSLRAARGMRVLDRLTVERDWPQRMRVDDGPECVTQRLQIWGAANRVLLDDSQPGRPTQQAFVERIHRTYRNEVLHRFLFRS